ncbi:MAG: FeoA family protein [Gammaproteobacteria bacterium]
MTVALTTLTAGQRGTVAGFDDFDDTAARLLEMGVVEGAELEVVRFAPAGDPIEVRVMGYALSLRREDAARILLADVDGP